MIGRRTPRSDGEPDIRLKSFDDFDLRLGDVMRGERATMGKSLLDVQRELRIKASYIAAIENCDPSAFDTPGFIAGYVRSYARYLNMDPDRTFEAFCAESGFSPAHGMSADASIGRSRPEARRAPEPVASAARDPLAESRFAFGAPQDSLLSRIEPGAIGSLLVLLALVGAIGYGGLSVLREIQRVQLAPVDQTPVVLSDLDPLEAANGPVEEAMNGGPEAPSPDALDRLYRPQALDTPVLVARDAPISTLDPDTLGAFARSDRPAEPEIASAEPGPEPPAPDAAPMPQVVAEGPETVTLFAIRPAWVRVRAGDGSIIFEKILDAGEEYTLPRDAEAPTLRAGMSGSIYFEVGGDLYGPAGQGTNVVRSVAVSADAVRESYQLADFSQDPELSKVIARLEAESGADGDAE
ncbi:DUF4115 domain-containing protein [Rhodosalinus halophilus]|uniref:DUF4115 domain-containing protein n=1 Tax=Rhodosalinus halophilus TaxID=2259333 RepID=A0A365UCN1_9RHOB|nr:helix-turn-helix domain-containing protein [Rhodosalinus halophilus]RBI87132.1 DUF4115 domain-containing protein [Rhodosalinus halophilus]